MLNPLWKCFFFSKSVTDAWRICCRHSVSLEPITYTRLLGLSVSQQGSLEPSKVSVSMYPDPANPANPAALEHGLIEKRSRKTGALGDLGGVQPGHGGSGGCCVQGMEGPGGLFETTATSITCWFGTMLVANKSLV